MHQRDIRVRCGVLFDLHDKMTTDKTSCECFSPLLYFRDYFNIVPSKMFYRNSNSFCPFYQEWNDFYSVRANETIYAIILHSIYIFGNEMMISNPNSNSFFTTKKHHFMLMLRQTFLAKHKTISTKKGHIRTSYNMLSKWSYAKSKSTVEGHTCLFARLQ